MRKISLYIASSLDGFIARTDGSIDWLLQFQNSAGEDYGYADFLETVDTVLVGWNTYAQILKSGPYPDEVKSVVVFSHARGGTQEGHIRFVSGECRPIVHSLRSLPGKGIWLAGGAGLIRQCLESRLVDELTLTIIPRILGAGIPLFLPQSSAHTARLERVARFANGLVQLSYSLTDEQSSTLAS